jgi:type II secretory pathway pseudopilin PulG
MMRPTNKQSGILIIYELLIIFIFSTVMVGVISYAAYQLKVIRATALREQAFQIAEAGINYYQWHLAHFPADYQDGTGGAGPYVHSYVDKNTAQTIGNFTLTITPPVLGSTIVTIQSTGATTANPNIKRTITTKYGIPSLAKYSFLTNSDVWIGSTESVSGEMHSNGGIRFDGTGNSAITSSKATYSCTVTFGCSPTVTKNGIWGSAPQSTKNLWDYPVPNVDFSSITSDLAGMKTSAQSGGIYLPPSNGQGYSLVFNSNATITIYKVSNLRNTPTGWDVNNVAHNEKIDYNNRTQIDGNTSLAGVQNFSMPANGVIFLEDNTWVEGTVRGRVLVAAATLPYNSASAPKIYIPNSIVYSAKDGTDVLGLVGQKDVVVTYFAPTNLEIDAAIIAQNGSAQRFYYPGNTKTSITVYGSISSFGVWTWSWVDGSGNLTSGYQTTTSTYDANLLFGPPPSYPLSAEGYRQISWSAN